MKLNHKFSFHVPNVAYVDGAFLSIPYDKFEKILGSKLLSIGIDGWHIIPATGYYKGRSYPQDILTIFSSYEQQTEVIKAFRTTVTEMHEVMMQESYAYEHDGVLSIMEIE